MRLILRGLALLLCVLLLGTGALAWLNRDIPVAVLESKYGGDNLRKVIIDGVELRYKIEGSGPPLVLIHSHFYTMRQWQPWVDLLADNFTLIRYDLTSHGLTGPDPTGDYSRARGTALLEALLDHLEIDRASIAGSSTGGALAWYFAAHYPDRVNKLVLINAPGMPRITNKYMQYELPDWGAYLFYLLPQQLFRAFLAAPVFDKSLITEERVQEFHEMYRRDGNRHAEYRRMQAWEKGDIAPTLATIIAPTLILWGEQNPQLPVEHVQQYRSALTSAPIVESIVYPSIGHVIPLEIPEQSALDTRRFLLEH